MGRARSDQIFRREALDHLSTPDQLDQLLRVVTLKSWIPLAVIAGGMLAAGVWSVVGRIPVSVEGAGLLIHPRGVVSFQSPASGEITSFHVRLNDKVEKGQALGRINQPELNQRLEQERLRLAQLQRQDRRLREIWQQRRAREAAWIEGRRKQIQERIATIRETAGERHAKSQAYFQQQSENLAQLRELTEQATSDAGDQYERFQRLFQQGRATEIEVAEARREFFDGRIKLADVGLRRHALDLQKIEADASLREQMDRIAELQSRIDELNVELTRFEQLEEEAAAKRAMEIQEAQARVEQLERELEEKQHIIAGHSGRVLEITAAVGQIVREGQRLGSLETTRAQDELGVVAYYPVAEGKRIRPGMPTRISPTTVQRERYGSMLGRVKSVSPFPVTTDAVTSTVGNAEVARRLTSGGDKIEVVAMLEKDATSHSGFRWTSGQGPEARISAGTTVSMRTTVESRRPISYLLPLLRQWGGTGG